jgi:phosphogluconate dehydratase
VRLDAVAGTLDVLVDAAEWQARVPAQLPAAQAEDNGFGFGRELFAGFRRNALSAEEGACSWL